MVNLCTTAQYTQDGKLDNEKWNLNKCYFKFIQQGYTDSILQINEDMRKSINSIFEQYSQETNNFTQFTDFGYNIIELCNNTIQRDQNLCAPYLQQKCQNIDIETTGQQRICGCYQNIDNVECSFGCNAPYTIQNGKSCVEQRCIIDNISIQSINSNIKNININQACANCTPETPCICIFNASSSNPAIVGSAYSSLESNCNASLCSIDGNSISCDLLPKNSNTGSRNITLWIFLFIIGILIIISLFLSLTYKE